MGNVALDSAPDQRPSWYFYALAAGILMLGCWWRLSGIRSWPDHTPNLIQTTQIECDNASVARTFWLNFRAGPLEQYEEQWRAIDPIRRDEPPILPVLAALTYLALDSEQPWVGPVWGVAFWLGGGAFLYSLLKRNVGHVGALFGLAFFLLAPFGILISRNFQCDSLMVFGFLVGLWHLVRTESRRDWTMTVLSGCVCGLALLPKPGIMLFPLAGAYAGLSLGTHGFRKTFLSPRTYVFGALTALPSFLYFKLFLQHQVGLQFMPELLTTAEFYTGWWGNIERVTTGLAFLGAILGAAVYRTTFMRLGLLLGYLAYSLIFSYPTMTHDYYLVPLIPIVAVCLAPVGQALVRAAPAQYVPAWAGTIGVLVALAVCLELSMPAARELEAGRAISAERADHYQEVTEAIGRCAPVICLSEEYGKPLMYHSWAIVMAMWPYSWEADVWKNYFGITDLEQLKNRVTVKQVLNRILEETGPAYFVVTDFYDFEQYPTLKRVLDRYPVVHFSDHVLIYDLTGKGPTPRRTASRCNAARP